MSTERGAAHVCTRGEIAQGRKNGEKERGREGGENGKPEHLLETKYGARNVGRPLHLCSSTIDFGRYISLSVMMPALLNCQ